MIWRGDCRCDSVIFLFVSAWFAHWKIGIKPTECTTSFTQIISKIKWKRNVCECASQITAENSTVQLGHKSLCVRFVNYIVIDWTACMRSFEYASSTRPPPFKHIIEMEFLAYFQQVQFTRKTIYLCAFNLKFEIYGNFTNSLHASSFVSTSFEIVCSAQTNFYTYFYGHSEKFRIYQEQAMH